MNKIVILVKQPVIIIPEYLSAQNDLVYEQRNNKRQCFASQRILSSDKIKEQEAKLSIG